MASGTHGSAFEKEDNISILVYLKNIYTCRTLDSTLARAIVAYLQVSEDGARHCLWRQPVPLCILNLSTIITLGVRCVPYIPKPVEVVIAWRRPAYPACVLCPPDDEVKPASGLAAQGSPPG